MGWFFPYLNIGKYANGTYDFDPAQKTRKSLCPILLNERQVNFKTYNIIVGFISSYISTEIKLIKRKRDPICNQVKSN